MAIYFVVSNELQSVSFLPKLMTCCTRKFLEYNPFRRTDCHSYYCFAQTIYLVQYEAAQLFQAAVRTIMNVNYCAHLKKNVRMREMTVFPSINILLFVQSILRCYSVVSSACFSEYTHMTVCSFESMKSANWDSFYTQEEPWCRVWTYHGFIY